MEAEDFGKLGIREALSKLHAGTGGLSDREARERLARFGYNEVIRKRENRALLLLKKFYGPVQLLIILVAALSYVQGHMADFYIVVALLFVNVFVSFAEEYRADRAIEALRKRLSGRPRVLRSGSWKSLETRELVPGDIIRLRAGDIVPADCKALRCEVLEADESAITGESLPIVKEQNSILYEGSSIKRGEATCVVFGTGPDTTYGRIEKLVSEAKPKSHLQEIILRIVRYLVVADAVVIVLMLAYGMLYLHETALAMLPLLLVVFIASVPVALAPAFTVSMALGIERLLRKSILVSRMDSMEDTATMDVLCVDKTGTLTQNRINVEEAKPLACSEAELLRYAAEASRKEDNDPIDNAVLDYAAAKKVRRCRQLEFTPFDPSTKRTEAIIEDGLSRYRVVKGSVKVVSAMCSAEKAIRKELEKTTSIFASKGLRSIVVAKGSVSGRLKLMGIIALYDAPRKDAAALIGELKGMGVAIKMLTGDNEQTAENIAGKLGIGNHIIDVKKASEREIYRKIDSSDGFADIYPEDKYLIVKALQKEGHTTGMTGDGINDAPALKQAEVGIAVESATDIAKSSASLVLTKNGIEVIIEAVKESRRIFERMTIYTMAKVSKAIQIIAFVGILFVLLKGAFPITPFLLILLIFTNDIVNISISTDTVSYSKKPDIWNVKGIVYTSAVIGMLMLIQTLLLVGIVKWSLGAGLAEMQTAAFLFLNVSDKFTVLNIREKRPFWKSRPSNALIISAVAGILVGVILSYYGIFIARIGLLSIAAVFGIAVASLFVNDAAKLLLFKHFEIG